MFSVGVHSQFIYCAVVMQQHFHFPSSKAHRYSTEERNLVSKIFLKTNHTDWEAAVEKGKEVKASFLSLLPGQKEESLNLSTLHWAASSPA